MIVAVGASGLCACGPAAASLPKAGAGAGAPGEAGAGTAASGDEPEEGGLYSLFTFPPATTAPAAAAPGSEIEHPETSGTCVGEPSKAAKKGHTLTRAMCCYTSPSVFISRIQTKRDDFAACYRDALLRDPKTQGRVVSKFVIEEDGSVMSACDAGSTVGDPELVECILRTMTTVTFEAYTVGDPCPPFTLVYPLQFSLSDATSSSQ